MVNVKRTIAALSVVSAATTAALFGACSDSDDNVVTPPPPGPAAACNANALNLTQTVVDAQGNAVANNAFETREAVFLSVVATDPTQALRDQDFAFQVTDASGTTLSSDDIACRGFHIDAAGTITATSTTCAHVFTTVVDVNGVQRTVIKLSPFAVTTADANGQMTFVVQTLPACAGTTFPSTNILQTTFTVPQGEGGGSGSGSGSCGSDGSH